MLQLGVGFAPRFMRQPPLRSAHEVLLLVGVNGADISASVTGELTIEIAAPSLHAGKHRVDLAALAQGPVCLVPPSLGDPEGNGTQLVAEPGLWVTDAALGKMVIEGQWFLEGDLLPNMDGNIVTMSEAHAGRDIVYVETARQGSWAAFSPSAPITVPGRVEDTPTTPDPAFVVSPDATFAISPDPATPGVWQFEVAAPAYAAGSYRITEAELAEGPAALNAPSTTGPIARGQRLVTTAVVAVGIGGAISVDYEMRRNGVTLVAGDPLNYEIAPGDLGATLQVVALLSDANGGPVEVPGNAVHIPADALPVDTFDGVANGTNLVLAVSDSGEAWARADGSTAGTMEVFWGRAVPLGAAPRVHYLRGAANRGVRQWAECDIGRPSSLNHRGVSPLIRGTATNGIFVQTPRLSVNSTFVVRQKVGAAVTDLFSFEAPPGWADAAANAFRLRVEADGAAVEAFVNGISVGTGTTSLAGGGCGLSTADYINNRTDSGFADNFACGGSN